MQSYPQIINYLSFQYERLDVNHNNEVSNPALYKDRVGYSIVDTFESSVTLMVDFMRCIPGFSQLHKHDQSELLKGMSYPIITNQNSLKF